MTAVMLVAVNLGGYAFVLRDLPPAILIWPLVFGLGALLVLTALPIGRPRPDLREILRRLDVDERIRDEMTRRDVSPLFASALLERMLRPVLDDFGGLLRRTLGRFGLSGGEELDRKLRIAGGGMEPAQFFGQKALSGLLGLAFFPLMDVIGVHPFGRWPVWVWVVAFVAGFVAPDWQLDQRLRSRRMRCLMELPAVIDMLTIATSAGLALEQALERVARQSHGGIGLELRHVALELAVGQRSLVEALEAMADRNDLPELNSFVGHLKAAHEQGIPLSQALSTQAEALREQQRLRLVEQGGKATVRMVLPVALFILPVVIVVVLVPAVVEFLQIAS